MTKQRFHNQLFTTIFELDNEPLTGNIYKEVFYDRGKRYVNYYIDCAECGRRIGEHGFAPGHTVTNRIKQKGWKKHNEHGKWVCPDCLMTCQEQDSLLSGIK